MSSPFELDGYSITLIDTPGFDDTLKTDAEILDIVCEFLLTEFVNIAVLVLLSHNHR